MKIRSEPIRGKVYRNLDSPESRAFWESSEDEAWRGDEQRPPKSTRGLCHICNRPGVTITHDVRGLTAHSRWNGERHVQAAYFTLGGISNACSLACAQAEATAWIVEGRFDKVEIRTL